MVESPPNDQPPQSAPGQSAPEPTAPVLFDVEALLDDSEPRRRVGWFGPLFGGLLVLILASTFLSSRSIQWKNAIDLFSAIVMIGVGGAMAILMATTARRQRAERSRVDAIEELIQLRRWPEAAVLLRDSLSSPALTAEIRLQLLLLLCIVLSRYARFDEAIAVQNELLSLVDPNGPTAHGLRLARAMSMLREDHLHDADRAISELRREVSRGGSDQLSDENAASPENMEKEPAISGGLSLVEMYRDVKTGHAAEAIAMFNRTRLAIRDQLGHRVGDAHALAAKAFDFLGDVENAQRQWENATLLVPSLELTRRFPELQSIASRYQPADAPAEAA